jgi:hypothetical protein
MSREFLQHELEQALSLRSRLTGVSTSRVDYLITSDIIKLLKALKLYLVIFSMAFLRPAVIIAFLKVPVCAKAFRILQTLTTSVAFGCEPSIINLTRYPHRLMLVARHPIFQR